MGGVNAGQQHSRIRRAETQPDRQDSGWRRLRRHHPDMSVRIGKRACVAPRLLPRLGNDLSPGLARPPEHLVDLFVGLRAKIQDAFAAPARRNAVIANDPTEAACRDQHDAYAIVESELQRLRDAVFRRLTHGLEAQPIAVKGERGLSIGDRQTHDYRCVAHRVCLLGNIVDGVSGMLVYRPFHEPKLIADRASSRLPRQRTPSRTGVAISSDNG